MNDKTQFVLELYKNSVIKHITELNPLLNKYGYCFYNEKHRFIIIKQLLSDTIAVQGTKEFTGFGSKHIDHSNSEIIQIKKRLEFLNGL